MECGMKVGKKERKDGDEENLLGKWERGNDGYQKGMKVRKREG